MREPDVITTSGAPRAEGGFERLIRGQNAPEVTRSPLAAESACQCFDQNAGESDSFLRPLQGAFLIPPVLPVVLILY